MTLPCEQPGDSGEKVAPRHAIDFAHLSRMTSGEKALERDVLNLFERQAGMLLSRMQGASVPCAAAFAHTLCGSARGIGAWKVAAAAEHVELSARRAHPPALATALQALAAAVEEARAEIEKRLTS